MFQPKKSLIWNDSIQQYGGSDSDDETDNIIQNNIKDDIQDTFFNKNIETIKLVEVITDLRFDEGFPYTKDEFVDWHGTDVGYAKWNTAVPAYHYSIFPRVTDIMKFFVDFWDDENEFVVLSDRLYRKIRSKL